MGKDWHARIYAQIQVNQRRVLEFEVATQFHHGGGLEFGPDGLLYIGVGDGGPRKTPRARTGFDRLFRKNASYR